MSTPDFFRARLDAMIDLRHPLAVLATHMPWSEIEKSLAPLFARKARMGSMKLDADMFGPTAVVVAGGLSAAGRPRLPIRLMVALLYLKHAFNESDESVVERWAPGRVLSVLQRPAVLRTPPAVRSQPDRTLSSGAR